MKQTKTFYSINRIENWIFFLLPRSSIISVVLVLLVTTFGTSASFNFIDGQSEWAKITLVQNKGIWHFLNESTNEYVDGTISNCSDATIDAEKCPTELTIFKENLGEISENLFDGVFARLNIVNMNNCGLTQITRNRFRYATELRQLNLSRNQISALPAAIFEFASNIEVLDLSHNHIAIETIDPDVFENCVSLKELDLSHNRLKSLGADENNYWLNHLRNLEVLNLNYNYRYYDENNFYSSEGILVKSSAFDNNPNLVSLYAIDCRMDESDFHIVQNLFSKQIIIPRIYRVRRPSNRHTNIEQYNLLDFDLKILNISGRSTQELHIGNNFSVIIANDNSIQYVSIIESGASSFNSIVQEIYLSNNELSNIDFIFGLPALEVADFSWNKLIAINEKLTLGLPLLRILDLSFNQILRIDFKTLQQLPSLIHLDVSFNRLGEMELLPQSNVTTLNIVQNPIKKIILGASVIDMDMRHKYDGDNSNYYY